MKLFNTFCIASFLFLVILSCEKDEHIIQPEDLLAGTWKLTEMYAEDGKKMMYVNGMVRGSTYALKGQDFHTMTTFITNPNEFTSCGTYTLLTIFDNSGIIDTILVSAPKSTGTWSIENDTLIQIITGDTSVFTILELSGSNLSLKENVHVDSGYVYAGWSIFEHKEETVFTNYERQ